MPDEMLLQVNKPGRYIAQEWNVSRKDFDKAYIKFALCFPDLYEIGMSNLGIRILYSLLNGIPDVVCERVFSCAEDMEKVLRDNGSGIYSLESRKGLGEFDIIGFSLAHELSYTNVLNILQSGSIPLESSMRGNRYPLIIGGGPSTLNPEPMHEFFDLFVFGEAEEAIGEIIDIYRRYKEKYRGSSMDKEELLSILSRVEGVYVPSLYEVCYTPDGRIKEFSPRIEGIPKRIIKRFIKDLNTSCFPTDWMVPYIQTVHDRIALEIMRGCPNNCRFCQARTQYFPFRQRTPDNIVGLAETAYRKTGYEEVSLCGLSVSDFSGLEGLLKRLIGTFKENAVSVSLPSMKPKDFIGSISSLIASIKKTGLTFAPEAGSERMRKIMNKNFSVEEFFSVIERAYASGYQNIKLYFMTGLPFEADGDLDGIVDLCMQTLDLGKKAGRRAAQLSVSVNTLIPKPHTPFQWFRMEDIGGMEYKYNYLRNKLRHRRIRLSLRNPRMSFLEGVFSRGDRRLSRVVYNAFKKGARFDAWDNHFIFERWMDAFAESGIDPVFYLRERDKGEHLPWDILDIGISKEALRNEADKTIAMA
ncbi:MAG: TIGR03960 family B12-binding radical SAM protein [Candidatus Omnitrophota bacterium]|jgi:radical SAM family uncharacterized protein